MHVTNLGNGCNRTMNGIVLLGVSVFKDHHLATVAEGLLIIIVDFIFTITVNKIEMCRLQGFPDDYCDILSTRQSASLLGDGWTLPVIEHIFSFIKQ